MANEPINKALYNRVKSEAKRKFDRWPSAYGSAWLVKEYKRRGGKYKQDGGGMSQDALKSMQSFYEDFQSNKFDADAFKKTTNNLYDLGLKNEGTKTSYLKSVKGPGLFGTGLFGKNYYKRPGLFSKDTYYTDVNVQKGLDQKGNPYYVPFDEYNNENLIEPINDLPEFPEMAQGGGIPERYRNMGFNKVGAKKQSNRPGKKWMVLAKKGDKYKVVHGGYKGMKDFTQHGNPKRRERFWDRMGGRDSAKAKDPFSPLYWHKRFGTWQEGGQYNYDINNPIPQFEMGNSILSKMQNEAMRKGYLKQGGTPCYECGGSYAKGGTNNPGFKALPPYVQQKIKSNMQTGGMTPFNANPDYYNERLRNFIDLVNGTASDSLFSEMEQEGMMPQARYGMSYLPLAQNGKEQKVPYVYYKGKLMPYDEADRMLPQFNRFPKGTKIYNEYGDEIGTIRDYGQTVKGGKPKFEFKAADPNLTQEKLEEFANLYGQEALANAMAEGLIDEYTPVSRFIDQTMGRGVTAATNPFAEASTINYNNIADDNILTDPDIKRAYADNKAANNQNNSRTGSGTGSNTGSGAATSTGASGARATVKQQFEEINGPGSWQRAKDAGLTDGSAEANLALLERAQNNEDVLGSIIG